MPIHLPASTAHRTQGLKYVFTIIPEEELLSMLYGRELNLRKRVEQIVTESKTSLKELQTQHDKLSDWAKLKAANGSRRMTNVSEGDFPGVSNA